MPVPRHREHRVGIGADNVKQGGGGDHADHYPGDDAPGRDAAKENDRAADQDHQRGDFAN